MRCTVCARTSQTHDDVDTISLVPDTTHTPYPHVFLPYCYKGFSQLWRCPKILDTTLMHLWHRPETPHDIAFA